MTRGVGILTAALVALTSCEALDTSEWRSASPILKTQTRLLHPHEATSLLTRFCKTPVRRNEPDGMTCVTRRLGRGFSTIVDDTFHPKGVIFGHFLGPASDDAAVSGSSVETHPERWGGTLLLTHRGGVWIPIWYRSRMIIDVCQKFALPNKREMLLCEDEDGGMGHALHDLYSVDFQHPKDLEHSLLVEADTYDDGYISQKQVLKRLDWRTDKQGFSVNLITAEWKRVHPKRLPGYPKHRPPSVRLTFAISDEGLREISHAQGGE